jgi:branched-chain amino acid transport system ATP-binding protein
VFRVIKFLGTQGITILLVEQNVRHALEIADRACVIENGRVAMAGESAMLLTNDYIKKAYLGL